MKKKVIIEGGCKIQYRAVVYSPLKQGERPRSIALSFFTVTLLQRLLIEAGEKASRYRTRLLQPCLVALWETAKESLVLL